MSGSGGSYFGPSTPATSCQSLQFDAQLASPKAQVVIHLAIGNLLDVAFQNGNQQVVVALWHGQEAGGIVGPNLAQLRSCMSQGEQFQAKVLSVSGGQVRLRVYHI
ncbi:hypothetical protein [Enterobacter cloacae]|uniref:hypothetical protein n=1 Tax=Enterobacter cloacae TaxID=550 RepID=UPI00092F849D|nr:hypothetical protein [Enterobacter cloacae]MCM2486926.1 hypothetical protein [Enterobacter cloacae]MCM7136739.1 hypothetical protein [Enterobacter cloacae]MCU6250056.1 hypothetical protein [Enterobacter cloacae]MDE7636701.1 hypothetical protein [Enterobacter cloacae]MDR9914739.1 hypothetical protein [Enterobacter cloacae subsp. cloacae]